MFLNEIVKKAHKTITEYSEPVQYLNGRGIVGEDICKFSIGFSRVINVPKEDSVDYRALFEESYKFRAFQDKLLFPLRNILGEVNGLCTRTLDKKQYKQYFLSEANKAGAFFGLFEALPHIERTGRVFVHEGAINAISFSKVFPNTVSSLTSFLNEPQYELLSLICEKIVVIYDEDQAGEIGIYKMKKAYGEKLIESVSIGEDDSNKYLQMFGLKKFSEYIKYKIPGYLQG
jgi:DNA primase